MRLTVGQKLFGLLAGTTALLIIVGPLFLTQALDSSLPNRYVKISDSIASHVGVNYEIGFETILPSTIGSIEAEFCENDPFPGTSCTVPVGFDISSAVLISQTGTNDFSIDVPNTNAHTIVFSRAPSVVGTVAFAFELSGVRNADNVGSQFVRFRTFTAAGTGGSVTDSAGAAFSINGDISVSTEVPPYIDLCVGVTITNDDCTNVVGDSIDLGSLSKNQTAKGTSQFAIATNADNGYVVTISGNSLTSGNNVIDPIGSMSASVASTNQFGINLKQNIAPSIGSEPAGPGNAAPVGNYAIPDNYTFNNGDVIASVGLPDNYRKFTVSYIANINPAQPAGYYAATISFIALGTF